MRTQLRVGCDQGGSWRRVRERTAVGIDQESSRYPELGYRFEWQRLLLRKGSVVDVLERLEDLAARNPGIVVFPEGTDPSVIEAARELVDREAASVILVGALDEIAQAAIHKRIDLDGLGLVDVSGGLLDEFVDSYVVETGFPVEVARSFFTQPLFFAAAMVKHGYADVMVAGVATPTEDVIMASEMVIGLEPGIDSPSSFFLMDIPGWKGSEGSLLAFADCAVIPQPDASALADIGVATAGSVATLLGWEPRVAFLSFSSVGSADHPDVAKVREAVVLARDKAPGVAFDGEFQADTAIVGAVASRKLVDVGDVAGKANVLVFPDLDAGNIAYKLVQRLTGGRAIGPILQGFAHPVSDLSRGASVGDIVSSSIVALAMRG